MALFGISMILLLLGGLLAVFVFYLINLQDLLKECSPKNQQMPPGNVWLMFIPVFNVIYPFIMYPKISESIKREFEERNSPQDGDYLKGIGMAMAIITLCSSLISFVSDQSAIESLMSVASLVLLIIYWVKSYGYKVKLKNIPRQVGSVRISDNPDLLD